MKKKCLVLNKNDSVGIILDSQVDYGDMIKIIGSDEESLLVNETVCPGHKIALRSINKGEVVLKYGMPIGIASTFISQGAHVHLHNLLYSSDVMFSTSDKTDIITPTLPDGLPDTFQGYLRIDERTGTRNYIVILSASNCAATVVKRITRHFENKVLADGIDGVIPLTYNGGCALAENGYYFNQLNRTLAGWLDHPNVVGAVIVGLGCETIRYETIINFISEKSELLVNKRLMNFNIQDIGGTQKSISYGIQLVNDLLTNLPKYNRTPVNISNLMLALNCGGSDSYSGLTANPTLGYVSDWITGRDGITILAEIPECNGAEDLLIKRCQNSEDQKKLIEILNRWKKYTAYNEVCMDNNLSTGNKKGGLTTILEKSLGAIAKGGTRPISQVLEYAERPTRKGLLLMDTPGFDPVSMTGLIASGCNMGVFTTGRGSLYGCAITPVIKVSTNSNLLKSMDSDIDLDAGQITDGIPIESISRQLYTLIINVAGGFKTKSEINGIGLEEFVPWNSGEVL